MKRWLSLSQLARTRRVSRSRAGYTIVEVMTVLAVSTGMFVAIAILFNGRQATVEFTQGVRNYETLIQNTIDDVTNGVYESDANCFVVGATGVVNIDNSLNDGSGTREDCIFLGKLIVPTRTSGPVNTSNEDTVATIVGRRLIGAAPASSIADANPIEDSSIRDSSVRTFQLQVTRISRLSDPTQEVPIIGYMYRLSGSAANTSLVTLHGLVGGTVPVNIGAATLSNTSLENLVPLDDGVMVCLKGQNNQRAELRIGGNGASTTTFVSELATDIRPGVCP